MISDDKRKWLDRVSLAGGLETPSQITDVALLRKQCALFRQNFPSIKLFYAVKSFSDINVINAIDLYVDGYDAASIKEISMLIGRGVDPDRIGFSSPVKSSTAIVEAFKAGVSKYAFQSTGELEKIARCAPGSSVYLRVRMHDASGAISFSSKFGCEQSEAISLLRDAQNLGLVPLGVTFHVGSQAKEAGAWHDAILRAKNIVKQAENAGIKLSLINMGGGLPAQYQPGDTPVRKIAAAVNDAIADNKEGIEYIAEPGRFVVANSSAIISTVIGVEDRKDSTWLFLDIGAFQGFIEIFEFHTFPYPVYSLRHVSDVPYSGPTKGYVLTGPTCDSYDTMAYDVKLPANIEVGDRLLITMTGAYTVVYGSNFNGFDIPGRIFIDSEKKDHSS